MGGPVVDVLANALTSDDTAVRGHAAEVLVALADPIDAGIREHREGVDCSAKAAQVLRTSNAPEVDGALLMRTVTDDQPGPAAAAQHLRDERA